MTKNFNNKALEIDALTEVCNIGAGHAATALSQLLDRKVTITVPSLEMIPLRDLPDAAGGAETPIVAVYVIVLGTVTGNMLFLLPLESAARLASVLRGRNRSGGELSPADRGLIKQAGVVTISSYLGALTRFLNVQLIPSEASIAHDMAGAIFDTVAAKMGAQADYGLLVQTEFTDESTTIAARICFLPDPRGQEVILEKIRAW